MSGRARHREFGGAGGDRERQQQLVGEMELDTGRRCVMLAQGGGRLLGDDFGRAAQPAIGGETRRQRCVVGGQEDAGAGIGRNDPLRLDVDGDAEVGCRAAADALQGAAFERAGGAARLRSGRRRTSGRRRCRRPRRRRPDTIPSVSARHREESP
jgi:hypothetical protein